MINSAGLSKIVQVSVDYINNSNVFMLFIVLSTIALFVLIFLVFNNLTPLEIGLETSHLNGRFCSFCIPYLSCCKLRSSFKMITKITFVFLLACIAFSIFISCFLSSINTENDYNNKFEFNASFIQDPKHSVLGDKFENLFWFIHISDTHLSYYQNSDRKSDLLSLCRYVIPSVKPTVFVLSGDITDARSRDPMGSGQHKKEWLMYDEIHKKCLEYNPRLIWLDIKGNHDTFNVYQWRDNFHKNFTVQGNMSREGLSYRYEVNTEDGNKYSFIAADACLKPGLKRPFNFVGRFDQAELERIKVLKQQSTNSSYTIWFGHYPTSVIANNYDFRPLINGPYLCGHFHTLNGLAKHMISSQPQGYLEAELGDWKDNRAFRIAAVDGGLFTFADYSYIRHKDLPLIVITNPRSVQHQMEHIEPFWKTANSTHIRALVFSNRPLIQVKAYISTQLKFDKSFIIDSVELEHIQGPLWVGKWSPNAYRKGLYYITVIATNEHYSNKITVPFSLDQTKPDFYFMSRVILRINFKSIGIFLFFWGFCISTLPLLILKFFTKNDASYFRHMFNQSRRSYFRKIIFKLFLLTHINKIFYPMIFIPIYTLTGPWFIGHFVYDKLGIAFIWGQFVEGQYLPVAFTFVFAAIFITVFHIPFLLCLSSLIYSRYIKIIYSLPFDNNTNDVNVDKNDNNQSDISKDESEFNLCDYISFNTFFLLSITILQGFVSSLYYFAYGYLAIITNFFTWVSLIYLILIAFVFKISSNDFKNGHYQQYQPLEPNLNIN